MRYIFDDKDWEELSEILGTLTAFLGRVSVQCEKDPREVLRFVKNGESDLNKNGEE